MTYCQHFMTVIIMSDLKPTVLKKTNQSTECSLWAEAVCTENVCVSVIKVQTQLIHIVFISLVRVTSTVEIQPLFSIWNVKCQPIFVYIWLCCRLHLKFPFITRSLFLLKSLKPTRCFFRVRHQSMKLLFKWKESPIRHYQFTIYFTKCVSRIHLHFSVHTTLF